jgi:hypothetical protein
MKKMLVVLTLIVFATVSAGADGPSVTVQNQETWRFWYVLDPPGFAEESPGSAWLAAKVAAYLATEGAEFPFTALEPAETMTFTGLTEGTHFLLGFFEDDSLEEFPVRLITLQADSSMTARHYDVYSLPELMMAARGQGMLAQFARASEAVAKVEETAVEETAAAEEPAVEAVEEPQAADIVEQPASEEPVESGDLATFADSYDPVYFTRESRDGFIVLPIASSRAWGMPGTRLSAFTGRLADGTLTAVLRSPDGFAKNVSCFFYVFPARTAGGACTYTFEARPDADGRAAVVLWQKGRAVPRLIGTASTDGGEFTWTARADELPPEFAQELEPATTLDLTTAWLDETSGTWEEFYFTTFAVADLTR